TRTATRSTKTRSTIRQGRSQEEAGRSNAISNKENAMSVNMEDIRKMSGKEYQAAMKDPIRGPEIRAAIEAHNNQIVTQQQSEQASREAKASEVAARAQADEEAAKNSKMSLEAFMALTPQERVDRLAELERSKHDDREKREKDEVASKGAAEREAWRRNSLTPQQRAAEDRERAEAIARAEEEQAAAEKAAAEKEAADKEAAEKEVADKAAAEKAAADKEAADKEAAEKAAAEAAKTKTKRKI